MAEIPDFRAEEFDYPLPPGRIAQYPLENRDASKLLVCQKGIITENIFSNLPGYIEAGSILVFNNTRVIRARLIFSKETGATIEIFCLEPISPSGDYHSALFQTGSCTWKCLIGNVKRWKEGTLNKVILHEETKYTLSAEKMEDLGDGCFAVRFYWQPAEKPFLEILENAGLIPLPPYISRASADLDNSRYQTIYAREEGSVAAPTAGFHFTEQILKDLHKKKCLFENVTLHVGLGTFRPVSSPDISQHVMHREKISVSIETIRSLLIRGEHPLTSVGTTTVRTLESLYWLGVILISKGSSVHPEVGQWDPYLSVLKREISPGEALGALLDYLERNQMTSYSGNTQLMILPGYKFRLTDVLITNFHMPQSTLLMLVSAFIGQSWKKAYEFALEHDFRFLSYGDACLFFKSTIV
ncbi:MAG: S-adenosylmethionine:tRNA ribosyltransferase-isomerase [Bacteroidetes bacterium]|nr:S-adenosylmethionine:tRNA ribosyltransferase-isomerase [Bacteroidota bacterium]